jgi:replicative superfamily II helicase
MSDLLQKFGVKELRDFQQESVDNLLEGKDVYLSVKTAAAKVFVIKPFT